MVSQVLESVADSVGAPFELISTEDLLAALANINKLTERLREENGGILDEEYELICIGSDSVALFPSLKQIRTGRI